VPVVNAAPVLEAPRLPLRTVRSAVATPRRTALILAGITVAAAVLRFWGLGHQSFWYDEGLTVMEVHYSLGRMLGLLPHIESNPPVYYTLVWAWTRIFGFGEAGFRSLSAVAGVATVPALYGVGAKLVSRRAGLVAAALAAFNPFLIWYSQEARSYSLAVLFATLSWLAFAHLRSPDASARWFVAWGVAAALTIATHYYGVLAAAPQAAWLLVARRRERKAWLALGAVAVVGAALLPLVLAQESLGNWISTYPLGRRLWQMAPQAVLGPEAPARDWLKLAAVLALALAVAMLVLRADAVERRGALFAGAFALAGFLLSLALVLVGLDNLLTRNVIVVLIALIVLVAGGLGARRAGLLGLAGTATLCVVGLVATVGVAVDRPFQRPDWRGLGRALAPGRTAGAYRAVLVQKSAGLYPLAIYVPGLRFMKRPGAPVQELDVVAAGPGTPGGWFCWWGSTCNLVPSALDTSIRIPGFRPDGPVLQEGQFSVLRLRAAAAVRLTPRVVARAVRRSEQPTWYFLYVQPPARR
jgi:4-amino-4-deoxy-L-arabinose transferase-like glycosyltransferase